MAKVSYQSIVDNPISKEQMQQVEQWWGTLDYKQQHSRIERHLPYAVIIGDVDIIYLFRVGRNNFKN